MGYKVVALLMSAGLLLGVKSAAFGEEKTAPPAKSAVLFVADGMGVGAITLLLNYANLYKKESTALEKVMREGRVALCLTQPTENLVPECSSAGTAMATGEKTNLLRVSQRSDGTPLKTILEIAQEAGKATGIVTTQRVTHSTPAVFCSHVANRSMEKEIADQQAVSGLQVLLGGGMDIWTPKNLEIAKARGFRLAETPEDLQKTKAGERVLGLFAPGHLPFALDRKAMAKPYSPSLSEMTAKALELLGESDKGFVLVVEQGALDQLEHENDAAGAIAEMLELDKALGIVMEYCKTHPETLVLVASDHDTGGLTLSAREDKSLETENDYGVPFDFAKLELQKASSHRLFDQMGENPSTEQIQKILSANTAYDISDDEALWIKVFPVDLFFPKYGGKPYGALGKVIAKRTGIVWVSQYHTIAMVPLIGIGPGSDQIIGLQENTDVFRVLKKALHF